MTATASRAALQQVSLSVILPSRQALAPAIHYNKHTVAWYSVSLQKMSLYSNISFTGLSRHVLSLSSFPCRPLHCPVKQQWPNKKLFRHSTKQALLFKAYRQILQLYSFLYSFHAWRVTFSLFSLHC